MFYYYITSLEVPCSVIQLILHVNKIKIFEVLGFSDGLIRLKTHNSVAEVIACIIANN